MVDVPTQPAKEQSRVNHVWSGFAILADVSAVVAVVSSQTSVIVSVVGLVALLAGLGAVWSRRGQLIGGWAILAMASIIAGTATLTVVVDRAITGIAEPSEVTPSGRQTVPSTAGPHLLPPTAAPKLPDTAYLADLKAVVDKSYEEWSDGPVTIDGHDYAHGIKNAHAGLDCNALREYALSGRYVTLRGIVGFTDDSLNVEPTSFEITSDGVVVFSDTIQLRKPVPIDLDVRGVVRLGISVGKKCEARTVALGDPTLSRS